MAAVKIALPKDFPFSTKLMIRINDVNYGNHLGNEQILSFAHEARMRYLDHYGYSEFNIGGVGIIMRDAAIAYRSEGFYGDEIEIRVAAGEFTTTGFTLFYKMINLETGKDLAHAETGIVCFDYDSRKVQRVPEAFRLKVTGGS